MEIEKKQDTLKVSGSKRWGIERMQLNNGLNQKVAHSFATLSLGCLLECTSVSSRTRRRSTLPSIQAQHKGISARRLSVQRLAMGRSAFLLGCLSIGTVLATTLPMQAAESSRSVYSKTAVISSQPPLPPDLGAPKGRTRGGASRGTCTQSQAMHAVLPSQSNRTYDLTTSDHPTLWFYLPERPNPETRLEFVLQDAADNYIYKTTFIQPNASAGLISVTVPEQTAPLVANASYNWTLSIQCNPNRPSQMSFIRGGIQKVAIALHQASAPHQTSTSSTALKAADRTVTARLFAQQGYWSDAITILAQTLQAQPLDSSATQLWQELLTQSGVTNLQPPSIAIRKSNVMEIGPTAIIP
jgi:hypothetical protein